MRIETWGDCFAERDAIAGRLRAADKAGLVSLPGGGYSIAAEFDGITVLVGASVTPRNLFYTSVGHRFFYGTTVLDVVRQSRLPWRWNWRALADVSTLEHSVDGETLHADVKKLRPASIVRFEHGRVSNWQLPWSERIRCPDASPEGAIAALVGACRVKSGDDVVVPISAGFDSRLLLACVLASGVKPRLITMGDGSGTDARVAQMIAKRFGLRVDLVPLNIEDFLTHGPAIVEITGGAKTFQNWHSYALAKRAPLIADARVLIGANGEAARTYYLDKGVASQAAQVLVSQPVKHAFWRMKLRPVFERDELSMLHPGLAREYRGRAMQGRVARLVDLSGGPLLTGLDRFYTEQRVSNFIANGIAMVDASARACTPMLDRAWMAQVWNLPREWKLDSRWHRFAISKLCPELLEFAEERTGQPMRPVPQSLYWLPWRKKARSVPYADYRQVMGSAPIRKFIRDSNPEIEPLARPGLLGRLFDLRVPRGDGIRAASFLLSILHLQQHLRRQGIPAEA